jgi:aspartyl-tRNA synthetase
VFKAAEAVRNEFCLRVTGVVAAGRHRQRQPEIGQDRSAATTEVLNASVYRSSSTTTTCRKPPA